MKRQFLMAAMLVCLAVPAGAQEWRSAYTDVDLAACTVISSYELGASFACPGYRGYPLLIAEGDLRFFVSYGFGAPDEPAAYQTFPQFNYLGPRIEWLLSADPEWGDIPVGTILRFFLAAPDHNDPDHQVLVVTRIEPGNTCQVAHIDARANPDANALAREAAKTLIPGFDCTRGEPKRVGNWTVE